MSINPEEFGSSFQGFMEHMATHQKPKEDPFFVRTIREHFDAEAKATSVISHAFGEHEHPDIQIALDEYVGREGRAAKMFGIVGQLSFHEQSLTELATTLDRREVREGPVEYVDVPLEGDRALPCVSRGLYLVSEGARRLAVYVCKPERFPDHVVRVEVMAPERVEAERFLRELRDTMRARSVFRGKVISLSSDRSSGLEIKFHSLAHVEREAIVLPAGVLEAVERHTVGFAAESEKLRAAGRHLKRGLLLHGPPGTGKTLTAMYLARAMTGRTVLLLTGRGLGLLGKTCAMARMLQPSTVILEDVDLIAEERTRAGAGCASPVLFELLNEMDGLSDDADVLFLLTTNRPELLEPALASRPGRVDQAIAIPLPDAEGRRRLFDLYGRGLTLNVSDWDRFIAKTEGASAAFIREMLRRAALGAAGDGGALVVGDRHLDEALHEIVVRGGDLTRSLLGFQPKLGFGAVERTPA